YVGFFYPRSIDCKLYIRCLTIHRLCCYWIKVLIDTWSICDDDECRSIYWSIYSGHSCSYSGGVPRSYDDSLGFPGHIGGTTGGKSSHFPECYGTCITHASFDNYYGYFSGWQYSWIYRYFVCSAFYSVIKTVIVHFYGTYRESKSSKEDALI